MNERFTADCLTTPAFGWPDRRAQFEDSNDPVSDHVAAIRHAIDNITSDEITPDHLAQLAATLGQMPVAHAMDVARQVGITTATSRRGAAERLRQKLSDLYYTHRKSRMYDVPPSQLSDAQQFGLDFSSIQQLVQTLQQYGGVPSDLHELLDIVKNPYVYGTAASPLPQFSDATQFVDLGMNLHTKTDVQSLDDMRGRRTQSKKYYNVVGKDFKTAGDQEIQRILQDEDFRQQLNGHIDALQNPDHSKEEWLAVQDFLRNEYKDYHLRNVKRGRMSRIPAKVMRSLMFPFLSSPHMKEFRNERFRAA